MIYIIKKYKNTILIFCLSIAIIYVMYGLYKDIDNTEQYMMNDFRSRVVATRLLNDGIDPYFYKWTPGNSKLYLDPRDFPSRPMSRVTVPPTTLLINDLLLGLSYVNQKRVCLIMQWLALIISIVFLTANLKSFSKKILLWIFGLVFFMGSWFFRFHVDAGQLYIFYVMLLSASYFILSRNENGDSFFGGFIIGYTASLRFNVIVFCIPVLITKKIRTIIGALIGFLINIIFTIIIWGIDPWINYSRALDFHSKVHLGWLHNAAPNSLVYSIKQVENVTHFDVKPRFLYSDSSLQWFIGIKSTVLVISLSIILLIYMYFLFKNRKNITSAEKVAFFGITAVCISEFFIPASRYAYYDVIWLLPLCLYLKLYETSLTTKLTINLLIILLGISLLSFGEIFPPLAVLTPLYLLFTTVWLSTVIIRFPKVTNVEKGMT